MSDTESADVKPHIERADETEVVNDESADHPDGESQAAPSGNKRRNIAIAAIALIIVIGVGAAYWLYSRQFESTDDAFIEGDITQISPKVSAYIAKVYVHGNQFVHKGDPLVDLDPRDYEIRLEQAKAQLENARSQRALAKANLGLTTKTTGAGREQAAAGVQTAEANVEQTRKAADAKQSLITQAKAVTRTAEATLAQTRAQVPQAQSNVQLAQIEYDRRLGLFNKGDISRQNLDQATNQLQTTRAQLDAAQKAVIAAQSRVDEANAAVAAATNNYRQSVSQISVTRSQVDESNGRLQDANAAPERIGVTEAQIGTTDAGIAAAEVAVHQAETELSYTKIIAPEDGYITRKTIQEGQLVQVGTPLMAISQADDVWVVANFKETQLENMQPGQEVDIKVDAYPNRTFRGKIESFQAGTGSRFSVLPPENATGNYVKVVQRVPVKIVFNEQPDKVLLAPGMSVEPRVRVR